MYVTLEILKVAKDLHSVFRSNLANNRFRNYYPKVASHLNQTFKMIKIKSLLL